ncbi:hypothetical protein ACFLV1_00625 [Chloroflexota bacterium]
MGIFLTVIGLALIASGAAVLVFPLTGLVNALVPMEIGIGGAAIITGFIYGVVGLAQAKNGTLEKVRLLNTSIVTVTVLLIVLFVLLWLIGWLFYFEGFGYLILYALLSGLYVLWGVIDRRNGRDTRIPLWLCIVLVLITPLLESPWILLVTLLLTSIVYATWRLTDRLSHHSTSFPFWFYLVVLLPVSLFAYHVFGVFFAG